MEWANLILASLTNSVIVIVVVGIFVKKYAIPVLLVRPVAKIQQEFKKDIESYKTELAKNLSYGQKTWDWKVEHYTEIIVVFDLVCRMWDEWLRANWKYEEEGGAFNDNLLKERERINKKTEDSGWKEVVATVTKHKLLASPSIIDLLSKIEEALINLHSGIDTQDWIEYLNEVTLRMGKIEKMRIELEERMRNEINI